MFSIKQHWKVTVPITALTLAVLGFVAYVAYVNVDPPTPGRAYTLPESSDSVREAVDDHPVAAAPESESFTKKITVDPDTREEMLAAYDDTIVAQEEQGHTLLANAAKIRALHDWTSTNVSPKKDELLADMPRDDALGVFARIEAHEIWDQFIDRVSKFDSPAQQLIIDRMRVHNPEVADDLVHDLAQRKGGAQ